MTTFLRWQLDPAIAVAMIGSALVGAQYIAGKAARDALFLGYYDASALPNMVILTSVFSIGMVVIGSRVLTRVAPSVWVPIAFGLSAASW
jgi:hypothetical protein